MNKLILVLSLLIVTGCGRKTTVEVKQEPLTTSSIIKTAKVDKYTITSEHGHEFTVEVTRFAVQDQTYNNTCRVTYIVTNTGNKDFIHRETFNTSRGGRTIKDGEPALVFEFTTADGKKIQKTQFFYDDISVGRSSEVRTMSIEVGLRSCDGEVKPMRIQYKEQ